MNVDEAKKRGPERHLTKNYNFAGPGTFYKARMKGSDFYEKLMKDSGRPVIGTKPYNKPYDKLDRCGYTHDAVYAKPNATAEQVKQADRNFQKCAQGVTLKDGVSDKLRSIASRVGFEGKIALESAGVLRKGSFAAGGTDKGKYGKGEVGSELGKVGAKLGSLGRKVAKKVGIGVKRN